MSYYDYELGAIGGKDVYRIFSQDLSTETIAICPSVWCANNVVEALRALEENRAVKKLLEENNIAVREGNLVEAIGFLLEERSKTESEIATLF